MLDSRVGVLSGMKGGRNAACVCLTPANWGWLSVLHAEHPKEMNTYFFVLDHNNCAEAGEWCVHIDSSFAESPTFFSLHMVHDSQSFDISLPSDNAAIPNRGLDRGLERFPHVSFVSSKA
jgi:hypothetical protein